jgi:hypothetical protein
MSDESRQRWEAYLKSPEVRANSIKTSTYIYKPSSSYCYAVDCLAQWHIAPFVSPRNVVAFNGFLYPVSWLGQPRRDGRPYKRAPSHAICVPRSIIEIGRHVNSRETGAIAFESNSQLAIIGESAFSDCNRLSSLWLPSSVQTLGAQCFQGCLNLSAVLFAPNSQLTVIQTAAFARCANLRSICLPSSVASIPDRCFEDCCRLWSVAYEEGSQIASIGKSALGRCHALTAFCIPRWVTTIGLCLTQAGSPFDLTVDARNLHFSVADQLLLDLVNHAVICCSGDPSEVIIPASIQFVNRDAFYRRKSLQTVVFSNGSHLRVVGDWAFRECPDLRSICIPKFVEILSNSCFASCSHLSSVQFDADSKLVRIERQAFYECWSLAEICVPCSLTITGRSAFCHCRGLKSLTFEANSSLLTLGDQSFRLCSALTSIVIPNSVENLWRECFEGCAGLVAVEFEADSRVVSIGASACRGLRQVRALCIPSQSSNSAISALPIAASSAKLLSNRHRPCQRLARAHSGRPPH